MTKEIHRTASEQPASGEAARLRESHRKLALFHASGGQEVTWEEVESIVSAALSPPCEGAGE